MAAWRLEISTLGAPRTSAVARIAAGARSLVRPPSLGSIRVSVDLEPIARPALVLLRAGSSSAFYACNAACTRWAV